LHKIALNYQNAGEIRCVGMGHMWWWDDGMGWTSFKHGEIWHADFKFRMQVNILVMVIVCWDVFFFPTSTWGKARLWWWFDRDLIWEDTIQNAGEIWDLSRLSVSLALYIYILYMYTYIKI
jgi:hypothetical protein